jgi:transposase
VPDLLDQFRIPCWSAGRPWTTPETLPGDKANLAKANSVHLKALRIEAVIPQKCGRLANRETYGSRGGWPVGFDAEDMKNRNVGEGAFYKLKSWRGLATRYDRHAMIYRGGIDLDSIVLGLIT